MKSPLVSILIPAYNAEKWIAETIQSAVAQTWQHKEIIVLDDGSRDQTKAIAERFASQGVKVVSTENQGSSGARNALLRLCQGDYIQWLDADDLLSPSKIASQMAAFAGESNPRILLSGPWGFFSYRTRYAEFVPSLLWDDLPPVEWLFRKMVDNLHMQTATWLTSRELAEAAGPWDTRLQSDDDGEYFCRVLLASSGTRFVPDAKIFYRRTPSLSRVSYIGNSDDKKESMLVSMKLHVQYLRSLETSERTRKACLNYLQTWFENFYPERPDLVAQLQAMATELGGHLNEPHLRWKYAWIKPIFGWKNAKRAQRVLPQLKSAALMRLDRIMYSLESRKS
jgi:glycosyltransferase involved in cell wall biosynthesis